MATTNTVAGCRRRQDRRFITPRTGQPIDLISFTHSQRQTAMLLFKVTRILPLLLCLLTIRRVSAQPIINNDEGIALDGTLSKTSITFRISGTKDGFPDFACSLDSAPFALCQKPQMYNGLTAGMHTLQVAFALPDGTPATDPHDQSQFTWTVSTPPPTINNDMGLMKHGFTQSRDIAFSISGKRTGFKHWCELEGVSQQTCSDPESFFGLLDGKHTLRVYWVSDDGNVDMLASHAEFSWTIVNTPPNLAFVTLPYSIGKPATKNRDLQFKYEVSPMLDGDVISYSCELTTVGSKMVMVQPCNSTILYRGLGTLNAVLKYNFSVTATDRAGNKQTMNTTFFLDLLPLAVWMPPTAASFSSIPPRVTSKTTADLQFGTNKPGQVTLRCRLDSATSFTACPSSPYTGLSEGEHTLEMQATDWAGNVQTSFQYRRPANYQKLSTLAGTTTTFRWRVDLVALEVWLPALGTSFRTLPPPYTNKSSAIFQFGTSKTGVTILCRLDGTGSYSICPAGGYSGLLDGDHTLEIQARDLPGNLQTMMQVSRPSNDSNTSTPVNSTTNIFRWNVDRVAPVVKLINTQEEAVNCQHMKIQWITPEPAATPPTFTCHINKGPGFNCTSQPVHLLYTWTIDRSEMKLPPGQHTFSITAKDHGGNVSPPKIYTWTDDGRYSGNKEGNPDGMEVASVSSLPVIIGGGAGGAVLLLGIALAIVYRRRRDRAQHALKLRTQSKRTDSKLDISAPLQSIPPPRPTKRNSVTTLMSVDSKEQDAHVI